MLDPVPWAIGVPGAQHSHEVARVLAYAATGGGEGVIQPSDVKVRPLAVPGGSVLIGPGALSIRNRASSGASQTFVARVVSDETVPIAATGSGAGRTDLIALVVRDTSIPGNGATPADPAAGPYLKAEVITGVASTVTRLQDVAGYEFVSGYALARVTLPAATGTVTAAMVTDLRGLAQARERRAVRSIAQGGGTAAATRYNPLTATEMTVWPPSAAVDVDVPEWATHAILVATVSAYTVKSGNTNGQVAITMAGKTTPVSSFDENYTGTPHRGSITIAGEIELPPESPGTPDMVRVVGKRTSYTADGALDADGFTSTILDIQFVERVS